MMRWLIEQPDAALRYSFENPKLLPGSRELKEMGLAFLAKKNPMATQSILSRLNNRPASFRRPKEYRCHSSQQVRKLCCCRCNAGRSGRGLQKVIVPQVIDAVVPRPTIASSCPKIGKRAETHQPKPTPKQHPAFSRIPQSSWSSKIRLFESWFELVTLTAVRRGILLRGVVDLRLPACPPRRPIPAKPRL